MLTLVCVIVGVGGLKIQIDESASVFDLKKAILEKTSNTIKFGAHHLQLCLAKKDGVWLSANDADTILQSEVNTSSYLNMHSSFNLNQPELFGSGVSLGYDVIHVLTVIPSQVPPKRGSLTPAPTIPKFKQFDNRKKCLAECSLDQWKAGEVHNIPFIWKFMKPFGGCTEKKQIFWRLEEQQVVSILLDRWFPE